MRALLCKELGTAESLRIESIEDPLPGPGEVVIDVHAAGLNFPDTLIIAGKYQLQPELPFVPGAEAAGMISAIGEGVTDWGDSRFEFPWYFVPTAGLKEGDVISNGTRQYLVFPGNRGGSDALAPHRAAGLGFRIA